MDEVRRWGITEERYVIETDADERTLEGPFRILDDQVHDGARRVTVVPDPGRWIRFQVLERSGRAALNRRDRLVLSSGLLRLFPACALLRLVLIIPLALSGAFLLQGLG